MVTELITRYSKLGKPQIRQLKKILSVHGAGVVVAERTGLNINTVKRASEGRGVSEETISKIETFLSTLQ